MDRKRISKTMAHALRHAPWIYELEIDHEGWTSVEALLDGINSRQRANPITRADLQAVIDHQDKERYQIDGARIRALYGHSIHAKIEKRPGIPPAILYHGTAPKTVPIILKEGLKPMRRQYVHLSADVETASDVGGRRADQPVILKINTAEAIEAGVRFYQGNDLVWLADFVPPDHIESP